MIPQPPIHVLFVDDEPRILDGLRRQLRPLRMEWSMRFAESAEQGLAMLEETPADVVVADMRMPGMSGSAMLRLVQAKWPHTLRIILSGQTDQAELLKDVGAIHQFLQKPCEPAVLQAAVRRAASTRVLIESQQLRRISAGVNSLPLLGNSLKQLLGAIGSGLPATSIAALIETDVALKTKILQLVNTSFFGLPRRVTSLKDAVSLLGTKSIAVLAVTTQAFDALSDADSCREDVTRLWVESTQIGARAESLAKAAGAPPDVVEQSMLAGTLSLIGRALLIRYEPRRFADALIASQSGMPLHVAEQRFCGAPQQHVGGYALGLWAFADDIVEAVTFQASPSGSVVVTQNHPLAFLHAARCEHARPPLVEPLAPDATFLAKVGITVGSTAPVGSDA